MDPSTLRRDGTPATQLRASDQCGTTPAPDGSVLVGDWAQAGPKSRSAKQARFAISSEPGNAAPEASEPRKAPGVPERRLPRPVTCPTGPGGRRSTLGRGSVPPPELAFDAPAPEQRGCRQTNGGNRAVDRVPLMTAERVADLIRDHARRETSLRLVDGLRADTPGLARRPDLRRENGMTQVRRRMRENQIGPEPGSNTRPLGGSGRRLEAPPS
jgi:hypothetical protein